MRKWTYIIPVILTPTTAELRPLRACPRVLAQVDIALELQHANGWVICRLWVESYIPDTRRGILWIAVPSCVYKVLLRCCVCADESDKVMCIDGLCGKELDEDICGVLFAG